MIAGMMVFPYVPSSRRRRWLELLAVCVLVQALPGCDGTPAAASWRLKPEDPAAIAEGRKVYEAHCASCHGTGLQGQPNWRERDSSGRLPAPPHDASGHTWHHPDELLFRITKLGVAKAANLKNYDSAMPAYEGVLTDVQIVAALSYIKSTWPPEIRQRHERVNEAAKKNSR
jgi:S-disulfanyl-L-cysteine oxidoreductase SoxD